MTESNPEMLTRRKLKGDQPIPFDLAPGATEMAALAETLEIRGLRKLRFQGEVTPQGRSDWSLRAKLGATVVQGCVVTLADVVTRIDETVTRHFSPHARLPEDEEFEIPEDDMPDPLGDGIDLAQVMAESLALALPAYPRAEGAELGEATYTEPGKQPMSDADARPFAALKGLRDKLSDE